MKKIIYPPEYILTNSKKEHERILFLLFYNSFLIKEALNLNDIWIQGIEVKYNSMSEEHADMIFRDKYDPFVIFPDSTCYILELKSEEADHEVVGQIKKVVTILDKKGNSINHWNKTTGIAIAKSFTQSGLDLLKQEKYNAFLWSENKDKIKLIPAY